MDESSVDNLIESTYRSLFRVSARMPCNFLGQWDLLFLERRASKTKSFRYREFCISCQRSSSVLFSAFQFLSSRWMFHEKCFFRHFAAILSNRSYNLGLTRFLYIFGIELPPPRFTIYYVLQNSHAVFQISTLVRETRSCLFAMVYL